MHLSSLVIHFNMLCMDNAVKLVSITEYSEHWGIDRVTTYKLIEEKRITRYEDPDGKPLLNLAEKPVGIKKYGEKRKRAIS